MAQAMTELRQRLTELGDHIEAKIEDVNRKGILHGADREKAANWKLQHLSLRKATAAGKRAPGELTRDLEILRAAFERWFAHVDATAESRITGPAAGKPHPAP